MHITKYLYGSHGIHFCIFRCSSRLPTTLLQRSALLIGQYPLVCFSGSERYYRSIFYTSHYNILAISRNHHGTIFASKKVQRQQSFQELRWALPTYESTSRRRWVSHPRFPTTFSLHTPNVLLRSMSPRLSAWEQYEHRIKTGGTCQISPLSSITLIQFLRYYYLCGQLLESRREQVVLIRSLTVRDQLSNLWTWWDSNWNDSLEKEIYQSQPAVLASHLLAHRWKTHISRSSIPVAKAQKRCTSWLLHQVPNKGTQVISLCDFYFSKKKLSKSLASKIPQQQNGYSRQSKVDASTAESPDAPWISVGIRRLCPFFKHKRKPNGFEFMLRGHKATLPSRFSRSITAIVCEYWN